MNFRDIFKVIFAKINAMFAGNMTPDLLPYNQIRSIYKYQIQNAILGFLIDDANNPTKYANEMKKAMVQSFSEAFDRGYADAGGDTKEMEQADHTWVGNKQTTEIGFIGQLFDRLKELKKEEPDEDNTSEVDDRAEGYATTLDGVYAEGRLRGNKNIMLTFDGDDGQESCKDCQKWKGKRHSAKFWIKRGLIPGQPGNQNFACRGYNCEHYLFDDNGEIWAGH
jgi:hypothetical protein